VSRRHDRPPLNTPALHNAGAPVTPVLIGDDSKDYEAEITSTGTVANAKRTMNRVVNALRMPQSSSPGTVLARKLQG